MSQNDQSLRITEIFYSLQGEAKFVGCPTVFVRLTGCPLRCHYCDTAYAFTGGQSMEMDEILSEVEKHDARHVCVTGGEPLAQKGCLVLLQKLCDAGYIVSLETSGAMDISGVDSRVHRVIDIKTPGSGEADKNRLENLSLLSDRDQLKFVICSREDFDWAIQFCGLHGLWQSCMILFSPAYGQVEPRDLADWILQGNYPVRFQFQLHKMLWGDKPGV